MAVGFVWAASLPAAGKIVTPAWHYAAHFAAFSVYSAVWVLGLPRVSPLAVTAAVVAFGFAHEAYEILGHDHGFELDDALVDAAGAILGALGNPTRRRRAPTGVAPMEKKRRSD